MNKKGFTLIELLAVIVVLAIIALIATPVVMNTITEAQKGADLRSVEGYMKAWEAKYYEKWTQTGVKPATADIATTDIASGTEVICTGITEATKGWEATCEVNGEDYTYSNGKAEVKD